MTQFWKSRGRYETTAPVTTTLTRAEARQAVKNMPGALYCQMNTWAEETDNKGKPSWMITAICTAHNESFSGTRHQFGIWYGGHVTQQ